MSIFSTAARASAWRPRRMYAMASCNGASANSVVFSASTASFVFAKHDKDETSHVVNEPRQSRIPRGGSVGQLQCLFRLTGLKKNASGYRYWNGLEILRHYLSESRACSGAMPSSRYLGPSGPRLLDTSSLEPVPSLHQKLVLNQTLTCGTETYSADSSFNNAKLDEPPINFVRQCSVLMPVELQKDAPFLVSEVSPSAHAWCLSVERMDHSMILLFEGTTHLILKWSCDCTTSAVFLRSISFVTDDVRF